MYENSGCFLVANATQYAPYGEEIKNYVASSNRGRYKFTEKERDTETAYDYFGARYYNNKLGTWLSVDPLAEKYPGWNPYNYSLNNPTTNIDIFGMDVDDYKVNKDGDISLINKTDDKNDVLYATNEDGTIDEDKSITVKKGTLNNISTAQSATNPGENFTYMKVSGDKQAGALFEFLAINTNVEWSQTKYGANSNYISTSHNMRDDYSGSSLIKSLIENNYTLRESIHSHTSNPNKKNYGPSYNVINGQPSGDLVQAKWVETHCKIWPNVKNLQLSVYEATNKTYIRYNSQGVTK